MDNIDKLRQSVSGFAESLALPPFVHQINELVNQHAWKQAAAKEKIAMQKIADMWAIVQAVATVSSSCYSDAYGTSECPFCNSDPEINQIDNVRHEPDCIVTKARKMAAETQQEIMACTDC